MAGGLALACLGSVAGPALADQVVSYQVQPGDTILDIAGQFGVNPGDLVAANSLSDSNQLAVGQTLVIDIPTSATVAPKIDRPLYDLILTTGDASPSGAGLLPTDAGSTGAPPANSSSAPAPAPAPAPQPASPPAPAIIPVPYRSQFDGTVWAESNCGPTSLSMALGALGIDVGQIPLRSLANQQMGMADPNNGTTWESLAYAAKAEGATVTGLYSAGQKYQSWSIDQLKSQLSQGHPVMLLVYYRALPGHSASGYYGDHYIVALGFDQNGNLVFNDPASYGNGSGKLMTPAELTAAWSHTTAGLVRTAFAVSKGS